LHEPCQNFRLLTVPDGNLQNFLSDFIILKIQPDKYEQKLLFDKKFMQSCDYSYKEREAIPNFPLRKLKKIINMLKIYGMIIRIKVLLNEFLFHK